MKPDLGQTKDSTVPKTFTRTGWVGAMAFLGAALSSPLHATDFRYDFSSLTPGILATQPEVPEIGQDGWYTQRAYICGNPLIVLGSAPVGTSNMVQNTVGVIGARALPSGTYFTGYETSAVLQYDIKGTYYSGSQMFLGGNGNPATVLQDDWSGGQASLSPSLGSYNSTSGFYTFSVSPKKTNGGWDTAVSQVSTVPLGHWVRLRLVMNFAANGGAGAGSVFCQDLTAGATTFTAMSSLQNINLGMTGGGLAAGFTPGQWNQVGFRLNPNVTASSLDNIFVAPVADYPAWAAGWGLNILTDGAQDADPDHDGYTNLDECIHGTNPTVRGGVPGALLLETWNNLDGTTIEHLTLNRRYAGVPDTAQFVFSGASPVNRADSFGARMSGCLIAPVTGSYVFHVAGDDCCQLSLSTSESQFAKVKIAWATGSTNVNEWTKYSTQTAAAVTLQAGQKYYIEALTKESTLSDHLEIGWTLPGTTTIDVLPGSALESRAFDANDADGDNMPDDWEVLNGLNPAINDAGLDADNDGFTNLQEYQNNTNPQTASGIVGKWTHEFYANISGGRISDYIGVNGLLRTPDIKILSDSTERFKDFGDNYGERFRATLTVPNDGSYTFWVSGDDSVELWLSTNDRKFDKRLIASVDDVRSGYGNTGFREWDKAPGQKSESIALLAGQSYYIEVLHKEGNLSDHVSVAWAGPGFTRTLLPSSVLTSFVRDADDLDDDCLKDSWEVAHGLSATDNGLVNPDNGEYGDPDGDLICNRDEWLLGTDPRNADTDGDGYPDGQEVYFMGTDPLVPELANPTVVGDIAVDAKVGASANWVATPDGSIFSMETCGWIDYNLTVATTGFYIFEIRGSARGSGIQAHEDFPLDVYIDSNPINQNTKKTASTVLTSLNGQSGLAAGFAGWLTPGTHYMRIWNRNLLARRALQLDSMRIVKPSGVDANSDGMPDWVYDFLAARNSVTLTGLASFTSPCCLEGTSRSWLFTSVSANNSTAVPVTKGIDNHWYADVALNATGTTPVTVGFENGCLDQSLDIEWTAFNLAANTHLIIRRNDSLRLTAFVPGTIPGQTNVSITLDGLALATTTADQPYVCQFVTKGTHTLIATYLDASGLVTTATTTLDVLYADFGADLALYLNHTRYWALPDVPAAVPLENDKSLLLAPQTVSGGGRAFTVDATNLGTNTILARTAIGGPILDSGRVEGVLLSQSGNSEVPVINVLSNGDRVMDITVMITSLPPGGSIRIDVQIGGRSILFGDASGLFKILTAADFDANGLAHVYMVLASNIGTTCHSTLLYDSAGNLVGQM